MNDIILSSLIHLFVLFGEKNKMNREKSVDLISAYLSRFFGVRNIKSYIRLFTDLSEFYKDSDFMDLDGISDGICNNLLTKISQEDKDVLILRLMEFCCICNEDVDPSNSSFKRISDIFGISDAEFDDMASFVKSKETENVLLLYYDNCGLIKTLRINSISKLIVTYSGDHSVWMDDIKMMSGVFQVWQQSSLIKSSHFSPIYYSTIIRKYNGETNETIHFDGRDVNFAFSNNPGSGMHNLSLSLHDGELVAIMGGSGVGKSTLLGLLNGTMKPDSGSITINGYDIADPAVNKMIGYVPQDDLLFEELTVFDNLWFTAKLCFAELPEEELKERVLNILKQLGLDQAANLKVGSPINKYISGGQRKRLNIALELIREPAVLFLDEPTSGLSSTDTEKVIEILKELTNKGKLIITTIHQPSSDVFKLFDRLWILDTGGYPIYDGNPIEAVSYFKSAANYADPRSSACPVCGNVNPEIILNIIDEKQFDNSGKITDQRKIGAKEWHELYLEKRPKLKPAEKTSVPHSDQKRAGKFEQMMIFLRRNFKAKITNLQYVAVTLLEAPLLALICALLTRYKDGDVYTLMGNINFPSYMFMAIIVSVFLGMSGSAEEIIRDRAILKREKFLHLSYSSYIWSKIIYMAGVCLIQSFLFVLIGNLIIQIRGMLLIWLAVLFATSFLSALIGLFLSKSMNSVVAIYITIPLLLIPQILLCGLVVKFEDLAPNSKTGNVPLVADIIPSRWAFEGLSVGTYSMNRYESMLFDYDCQRYETIIWSKANIKLLQTANEELKNLVDLSDNERKENLALLRNELPYIEKLSGVKAPSGEWNYDILDSYFGKAQSVLNTISNKASLAIGKTIDAYANENGKDKLKEIKFSCYNKRLEELMTAASRTEVSKVVDGHIVPVKGILYQTPRSRIGRSPFYSGYKCLGYSVIPTYYFDLCILMLMCLIVGASLFVEKKN